MGSPLRTVGVINADVSTCIAGWLGRKPDMLPVRMTVSLGEQDAAADLQRADGPAAVAAADAGVHGPDQLGGHGRRVAGGDDGRAARPASSSRASAPLVIKDTFSGFSGGRAPAALYSQVAAVVNLLTYNPYQPVRIKRIECDTHIVARPAHAPTSRRSSWIPRPTPPATRSRRPCSCGRTRATAAAADGDAEAAGRPAGGRTTPRRSATTWPTSARRSATTRT